MEENRGRTIRQNRAEWGRIGEIYTQAIKQNRAEWGRIRENRKE